MRNLARDVLQAVVTNVGKLAHSMGIQLEAPAPYFLPNVEARSNVIRGVFR